MKVRQFISKNLAVIVMVPFIIGAHYGWLKLQEIDSLVPAEEREKNPFNKYIILAILASGISSIHFETSLD